MHIFSPVFRPRIFCPKILITIFQFFLRCAFCFLPIFQIELFTRGGVRVRRGWRLSRAPGFSGSRIRPKKIIRAQPFYWKVAITILRLLMFKFRREWRGCSEHRYNTQHEEFDSIFGRISQKFHVIFMRILRNF